MKKILLTTALTAIVSTSAFAISPTENHFDNQMSSENRFFLGFDMGGLHNHKYKIDTVKIKQKTAAEVSGSFGYYLLDNVRVEFVLNKPLMHKLKGSANLDNAPLITQPVGTKSFTKVELSNKTKILSSFVKVSGDVIDLGVGKIFLTGGLGWAQVKNSTTGTVTQARVMAPVPPAPGAPVPPAPAPNTIATKNYTETLKAKTSNNLAWVIGCGVSSEIAEGVHGLISYNYADYGKSKKPQIKDKQKAKGASVKIRSHIVSAGVRFDI